MYLNKMFKKRTVKSEELITVSHQLNLRIKSVIRQGGP